MVNVQDATATPQMATYQTEVTVKANEPDTDMYFDKWEVTGLDTTGMDLTKTEIKFQMPAGNVSLKATYRAIEKFAIEMVDGTKDKEVAKAGETVTITANPAPTGKVFDKWTCETAGVTIEFASATSKQTTFVMPASNIKIQAHFRAVDSKPSVEIKVNGGTGAGVVKKRWKHNRYSKRAGRRQSVHRLAGRKRKNRQHPKGIHLYGGGRNNSYRRI